jgi:uncharacterized membrane protein
MPDVLSVVVRWIHISSVVTLLGGIIFGRLVVWPGVRTLAPESGRALEETLAGRFRPFVYAAIAGLTLSGLYNIFSNPGHTARYHALLGIKLLLVLHVFAVAILVVKPKNERRARMMAGTIVSGLIIVAISAYLRRIF